MTTLLSRKQQVKFDTVSLASTQAQFVSLTRPPLCQPRLQLLLHPVPQPRRQLLIQAERRVRLARHADVLIQPPPPFASPCPQGRRRPHTWIQWLWPSSRSLLILPAYTTILSSNERLVTSPVLLGPGSTTITPIQPCSKCSLTSPS